MSDFSDIVDRANKAHSSLHKLEDLLQSEPSNKAAKINLRSVRKLARKASEDLEKFAAQKRIEVCNYRIVPMEESGYLLRHVARSLFEYQNMFSQIYDSYKNGPKKRAFIGQEAASESDLEFAYTYSGSLGVVLLAQNSHDFFEGSLDTSISAIYDIMEIGNSEVVRQIAEEMGVAVVKRIHDWSKAHTDGGFSADIRWKCSDGKLLGQMIDRAQLEDITEIIDQSSDEKSDTLSVFGMLVGGDIETGTFHLTVANGESYRGYIDKDFIRSSEMTLGSNYEAKIGVSDIYHYATDEHKINYTLKDLSGPFSAD